MSFSIVFADVALSVLQQAWSARELGTKVPPSRLALDSGDAVTVTVDGITMRFRIKAIETTTYRALDLVGFDPSLLVVASPPVGQPGAPRLGTFGPPVIEFMELPVTGQESELRAPRIAAYANPWCTHLSRTGLRRTSLIYRETTGKIRQLRRLRSIWAADWQDRAGP